MIPGGASRMRAGYLRNVVDEQVGAAQKHLQAIYADGLEIGPQIPLPKSNTEAIRNTRFGSWHPSPLHLKLCETALAEQPAVT